MVQKFEFPEDLSWDLNGCLEYNSAELVKQNERYNLVAVKEGRNDEENWIWILETEDGKFILLDAGCDYTGWDCQSWISEERYLTFEEAAEYYDKFNGNDQPLFESIGKSMGIDLSKMRFIDLSKLEEDD